MTIFEMLEKLEMEIVSLQARYQDLANSLQASHANGNGKRPTPRRKRLPASAKKKAAKGAAKRTRPRTSAASQSPNFEQLELQVQDAALSREQPARVLGKRQALGKSLGELRKMSAWRNARTDEE